MSRGRMTMLLSLLAFALALSAAGQVPPTAEGAITGNGAATIKRPPDLVRLEVQLSAEGKDLKDALAKLAQRRDACKKKLTGLGVKEDAVTFDAPRVDATDPRQQMEQMMRQRMGCGGLRATTGPAGGPTVHRVAVTARAEWPLTAKTPEELLVAATELQDKVKAADLGETKLGSLEEQEAREERAAAVADAFKKAKANAAELAKAAGAELGALKQLQSTDVPDMEQYQQMMMFGRYRGSMYQQAASTESNEAVAPQPGPVTIRVQVSASFSLK